MSDEHDFTIVGAGLAGALMAVYLGRAGRRVRLFEKRPDPRRGDADSGRSINLALSARGLFALTQVEVAAKVMEAAIPMRGRMIHALDGSLAYQAYGRNDDEAIHSVSRLGLNLVLLDAADALGNVEIHFDHRCTRYELNRDRLSFAVGPTGEKKVVERPGRIVGADGAFSAVRRALVSLDRFDYSQAYLEAGYKELTIPPTAAGEFALEPNALHIWPRGSFMMIALPNPDRSFTVTCFWPFAGPNGFDSMITDDDVKSFFASTFADALPLMPSLTQEFRANPVGSLCTIRTRPWHHGDRVVLIGDAAHAVVPFYGQGMNAAFEDCTILAEALETHGEDVGAAFREYDERHRVHVDALADLAIHNFVEMRDHVKRPSFRLRKKLDRVLSTLFPRLYKPLYGMVQFTRIPYADAVERARTQDRWLSFIGIALVFVAVVLAAWLI